MENQFLKKEDYEEPACPLCRNTVGNGHSVINTPVQRITEKLDVYLAKNDYAGAERHLKYWLEEAKTAGDKRGELHIYNEILGLMRKTSQKEKAYDAADNALRLIKELDFENTVTAGTTYVNIATVLKAFGEDRKSLQYYKKAEKIYLSKLEESDERFGGLYNNMALALAGEGSYDEAEKYYEKAIDIMKNAENGELEVAITYLNLADLEESRFGPEAAEEKISVLVEKAMELLDTPTLPRDGYYAFVCEKCAPSFGYYGYFLYENELKERAEKIHERS